MEGGELSFEWDVLVPRVVHPLKVAIIEAIRSIGQPLSASELTKVIDIEEFPLSNVSYHVRRLAEVGVVKAVRKRQVRGSVETFYFFPPGN
jgi:DNA-binding transcriptional ArsR family regulator